MNPETRMLKNLWEHKPKKNMSFLKFAFNKRGFGRTRWEAAIAIHLFGLAGVVMACTETAWALLSLVPVAALWLGTYLNYTGKWR